MSFFSRRVKRIISSVGQDIVFVDISYAINTSTGENVKTECMYNIKAFVRRYTPEELAGGLVLQTDREVKIAVDALRSPTLWTTEDGNQLITEDENDFCFTQDSANIIPKEQDRVIIDNKTYQVISAEVRNAKDKDCMYVLQVRGNAN